jgi:TRAP-type C4-dicarboxylate transport system permease small subunit
VTVLFSVCLVASLALDGAVVFAPERARRRLRIVLLIVLALAWIFLGAAVAQIASRTVGTLAVSPSGVRRPDLVRSAGHEARLVLASLGGPALLATLLGILALRTSRRRRPRPGHMERLK